MSTKKFYIKPFTKEWWSNFWYYYKWPTIVITIVVILLGMLIADLPFFQPKPDFAFMYAGHMRSMGSTDGYELERRFSPIISDLDGDGKYTVASEVIYIDEKEVSSTESAMGIVLDSSLAAGRETVYFAAEYMLPRFPADKMLDLGPIVEKYNIDESMVKRTESGSVYAVSMAGNPIFDGMPDVDTSDMYLLVRPLRPNDQSDYKKNIHNHGVEMAEHIISGGTFKPERKTYSIK